eukprot:801969-Pelagomonas_calceolata.AAC.1
MSTNFITVKSLECLAACDSLRKTRIKKLPGKELAMPRQRHFSQMMKRTLKPGSMQMLDVECLLTASWSGAKTQSSQVVPSPRVVIE